MEEELKDKIQDIIDEAELRIELAFIEFEVKLKRLFDGKIKGSKRNIC